MAKQLDMFALCYPCPVGEVCFRVKLVYDYREIITSYKDFQQTVKNYQAAGIIVTAVDVLKKQAKYRLHCHIPRV